MTGRYIGLSPVAEGAAYAWSYPEPSTASPADAEKYVGLFLDGRNLPDTTMRHAAFAAWNLVDNAGRHGAGTIRIGVTVSSDGVQIDVHDQGRAVEFGPDRNGLTEIKAFAAKFEIIPDRVGCGKTVTVLIPHGGV